MRVFVIGAMLTQRNMKKNRKGITLISDTFFLKKYIKWCIIYVRY